MVAGVFGSMTKLDVCVPGAGHDLNDEYSVRDDDDDVRRSHQLCA